MSRIVRGVDVPLNVQGSLRPVLEKTLDLFTVYRKRTNAANIEDAAHWYNERATLSVLAAAAWKQGGIALEEYSMRKHGGCAGRADLWIKMPSEMFSFEAKQTWTTVLPGRGRERASYWLREATRDAARVPKAEAQHRAGLVFVIPDLPQRRVDSFDPAAFVTEVRSAGCDFSAWWFASKPWPKSVKGRFYPGVVIVGRFVAERAAANRKPPAKAKAA